MIALGVCIKYSFETFKLKINVILSVLPLTQRLAKKLVHSVKDRKKHPKNVFILTSSSATAGCHPPGRRKERSKNFRWEHCHLSLHLQQVQHQWEEHSQCEENTASQHQVLCWHHLQWAVLCYSRLIRDNCKWQKFIIIINILIIRECWMWADTISLSFSLSLSLSLSHTHTHSVSKSSWVIKMNQNLAHTVF